MGCTNGGRAKGPVTLKAWFHTGTAGERDALTAQVNAFNTSQSTVKIELTLIPEGSYNDQVKAASAADDLPDVLDFDGPFLYNYAWSRQLAPLENCLSPELKNDLLPSLVKQGTYANRIYGVGTFDSGLGIYARKSLLEQNKIRIPQGIADAWTTDEFTQALKTFQAAGIKRPLDLKYNYGRSEWFTYGFAPVLWSAGAGLINLEGYPKADGTLNSPQAVRGLGVFQSWFKDGLVNYNEADNAFVQGQAAISLVGHWQYNDYKKAFGDDLLILPLPNFGQGSKTGLGSWQWGVSSRAKDVDAAWSFINFLLKPENIVQMTKANGAVPATRSAVNQSENYRPGGPEYIYVQQLETIAVPRPQTPAYPTITTAYRKAIQDISNGKDVKAALDEAVKTIDQDIKDADGYPVNP